MNRGPSEYSATAKVLSGTAVGQVATLLLYPVLARIYTPEAFGAFATFLTISSLLLPVVTGCYEQAIIQTQCSRERLQLSALVFKRIRWFLCICVFFVPALLVLDGILFAQSISILTAILLPLAVGCQATFLVMTEILVKIGSFNLLSIAKTINGSGSAISRVIFGGVGSSGGFMIAGDVVAKGLLAIWSLVILKKISTSMVNQHQTLQPGELAPETRFRRFPQVILPEQLLNILAGGIHIFVIAIFFGAESVGYVALVFSALYFPVTVITASFKDVFRSFGASAYESEGSCRPLFRKFLIMLAALGALLFTPLYLYSETFIALAFGNQWSRSAEFTQIMVPMFYANFVAMSFSGVMIFSDRLTAALKWQALSLIATIASLLWGAVVLQSLTWTLILFSATRTVSYLSYVVLAFFFSKKAVVKR